MSPNYANHPETKDLNVKTEIGVRVPTFDGERITRHPRPSSQLMNDLWSKLDTATTTAVKRLNYR